MLALSTVGPDAVRIESLTQALGVTKAAPTGISPSGTHDS